MQLRRAVISGVAVLALASAAAGCGSDDDPDAASADPPSSTPATTEAAEEEPTPEPVEDLATSLVSEVASTTSGSYDAEWSGGYTYNFAFEAEYGDASVDISSSPPGKAVLSFAWHVTATVTNTTEGRSAPAPGRVFNLEGAFPATSVLCAAGGDVDGLPVVRYPGGDVGTFPYCFAPLTPLGVTSAPELGSAPDIGPDGTQDIDVNGTFSEELDEDYANAAVDDLMGGPEMWVSGPFGLDEVEYTEDDCYSLLWWDSSASPCETAVGGDEPVEGNPEAAFVGTWSGDVMYKQIGMSPKKTGTMTVTITENPDGTLDGTRVLDLIRKSDCTHKMTDIEAPLDELSTWLVPKTKYCDPGDMDLVMNDDGTLLWGDGPEYNGTWATLELQG